MKLRKLPIILSSLVIVALFAYVLNENIRKGERLYTSPSEATVVHAVNDQGIRGAIEFYNATRANQHTGLIDPQDINRAFLQVDNMPKAKNSFVTWQSMGPDNVGGRTRALVIDRDNTSILYAGAVGGGFWKSTNRGQSWVKYSGHLDNLAINCMIQTTNGDIYFGTGEQNFTRMSTGVGNSGVTGRGIWKSTDRGETFTHLPASYPPPANPPVPGTNNRWNNINAMAAHPTDPNTIFVGSDDGLMVSTDGGATFTERFKPSNIFRLCTEIRISPDGQTIYAVFHNTTMSGGSIYRSTQGGASGSFTQIGSGEIPAGNSRIVLSIAPSNPNYVYASVARSNNNRLHGVYQSKDNGNSWRAIGTGSMHWDPMAHGPIGAGQGDYDNIVAVDPFDHERIFLGGVTFWMWSEQNNWQIASGLTAMGAGGAKNPHYIHADKHNVVFDTITRPYVMYVTTDGGIFRSTNAQGNPAPRFDEVNRGYITTQFYTVAANTLGEAVGGTQDNGTILLNESGPHRQSGYRIMGGDGAYVAFPRYHPDIIFASSQYGNLRRSINKGGAFQPFYDSNIPGNPGDPGFSPFVTPFALYEKDSHNTAFAVGLYSGVYVTFEALNFAVVPTWYRISPNLNPTSMKFSNDGNTLYVGATNGRLYRITGLNEVDSFAYDTLGNFNYINKGIVFEEIYNAGQYITNIGIDPTNDDRIMVTLGQYGNQSFVRMTINATDAVPTWKSIQANLPRMPVYDAVILKEDPRKILLATEWGVFGTDNAIGDNVTSWSEQNTGMERVATYMIKQVVLNREWEGSMLYIATHGRGIFKSTDFLSSDNRRPNSNTFKNNVMLAYPNPASEFVNLNFKLDSHNDVNVQIFDITGRVVETVRMGTQTPGELNINVNTSQYKRGTYIARLQAGQNSATAKFIVVD